MLAGSSDEDGLKRNLPLLRAVKEGKLGGKDGIDELLSAGAIDVNFENHCVLALQPLRMRVCELTLRVGIACSALLAVTWPIGYRLIMGLLRIQMATQR